MATVVDVRDVEQKRRRILAALLVVGILGASAIAYDQYSQTTVVKVPPDLDMLDTMIGALTNDGFIQSLYVPTSTLIVSDARWKGLREEDKKKYIVQFARYCAQRNNSPRWVLTVKLARSGEVVGQMGTGRMLVN